MFLILLSFCDLYLVLKKRLLAKIWILENIVKIKNSDFMSKLGSRYFTKIFRKFKFFFLCKNFKLVKFKSIFVKSRFLND